MTGVPVKDLFALIRQGPWTNKPDDSQYRKHWNMQDTRPGEHITNVYTGSMGHRLAGGMVNVRVAEGSEGRIVYVDKPKITRVGPVAKSAGEMADAFGTFEPLRLENPSIQINPRTNRVRISTDRGTINARTDLHLGRSNELPPRQQISNMVKLLRG